MILSGEELKFLGEVGARAQLGNYDYQRFQKIMTKLWRRRCYDNYEETRVVNRNGKTEIWVNGERMGAQG